MSNLIINDRNVARVETVLKYVNITFVGAIPGEEESRQIPGELMVVPGVVPQTEWGESIQYYSFLYNWLREGTTYPRPILVPDENTRYTIGWVNIAVPINTIQIVYSPSGTQVQVDPLIINSQYPLYIKGETMDGIIKRNVTISLTISQSSNLSFPYNLYVYMNIDGMIVNPGAPKNYTVKLSLYKDRIYTKFIGSVNVAVHAFNSTGPGE